MARPKRAMDQVVFDLDDYPNAVTSQVRDRMPVILNRGDYDLWLLEWTNNWQASMFFLHFAVRKDALSRLAVVIPTT
jgi:putative SOS response-associated peptidase YedK